jgi:PAS domain S-box-containing protein
MREGKEHFEQIFNLSPDASLITRLNDGLIVDINEGFTALTGFTREETIGKTILSLMLWKDPADRQKVFDELGKKEFIESFEALFQCKDGSQLVGSISAKTISLQGIPHIISMTRDITELKLVEEKLRRFSEELRLKVEERTKELRETQDQLIQSAKLSIIGELATGVAHEVRNPLAAISLITQNLERKSADSYQIEKLKTIQRNINRIDKIVNGLLNFSHPARFDFAYHDVNEILDRSGSILENFPSENTKIIKKYETKLPQAWLSPDLLEQVFSNLIFNAMQAMKKEGGELYITTSFDSTRKGIIIKFEDTGIGISEGNLKKIFKPFFTTSKEGTGLGLSICQNIINEHKGNISVESKLGKGTIFTIFLPLEKRKEKKLGLST